jgi:hypothetical protein
MKPRQGVGSSGKSINPHELPEEDKKPEGKPKSAPYPGSPVSEEEYERMKKAARDVPAPHSEHAQEDYPDKETKSD